MPKRDITLAIAIAIAIVGVAVKNIIAITAAHLIAQPR